MSRQIDDIFTSATHACFFALEHISLVDGLGCVAVGSAYRR